MTDQTLVVRASTLFNGKKFGESRDIVCEDGTIVDIRPSSGKAHFEGFVTPAFIDPHSHIGQSRAGEPASEDETNESLGHFHPLVNPLNSIYFDDAAFSDAVDFGVLYSCLVPGSGNLVGGRAVIIRNFAQHRAEAMVRDYGFKMALGYNPRSVTEWGGERPNTRMGTCEMLERRFDELLRKRKNAEMTLQRKQEDLEKEAHENATWWTPARTESRKQRLTEEFAGEFSSEETALLEILGGEKVAKVHVHKEDDVYYLIELAKRYGLNVTAEHTCDVFKTETFDALAAAGIPVVYGPLGSHPYKVELKHAHYRNVAALMKSRVAFGLMTDHPVIQSSSLRDSLKYFLIQGMSEADALALITSRNAKILGLDDTLGTLEVGKLASLVVWNQNPLHLGAFPQAVVGEGKILRQAAAKG